MENIKDFLNLQIASYASWWEWIAYIYVPVLSGFFN